LQGRGGSGQPRIDPQLGKNAPADIQTGGRGPAKQVLERGRTSLSWRSRAPFGRAFRSGRRGGEGDGPADLVARRESTIL
jgi:hypothetical protein